VTYADFTFDPTTSTSSRSCGRSARASARSAASTTPRRRSASWPTSSSRSSSIRAACGPICSSSSARRRRDAGAANFAFEDETLYETHRGFIRWIRKLLNPILKLFFNPNPLIRRCTSSRLNTQRKRESSTRSLRGHHNLVLELTRLGIEVKNLKMRVESMSSRLDFDERRARALEGVVMYPPGAVRAAAAAARPARRGEGEAAIRPSGGRAAGAAGRGAGGRARRPSGQARAATPRRRRRRGTPGARVGADRASRLGADTSSDS
jgi:hypothetical protein